MIEQIKIQLREDLLKLLKAKGLSQADVANTLGIDRRVVNRKLNAGFKSTSINSLIEMIEAAGGRVSVKVEW